MQSVDDIGVHVTSSRVGGPAVQERESEREGREKRERDRGGERTRPEAEKGKVGWLGRWSCGAAELRDRGGGVGERGWRRESGSAMTS